MAFNKDSTSGTLIVALVMCVVCGVIVSTAAVSLRPQQQANMLLDRQGNILRAAGLYEQGIDIEAEFAKIEQRFVDFATGEYVEKDDSYDQYAASSVEGESILLTSEQDVASVRRRANVGSVYLVNNEAGEVETLVLPVQGYGLWSTMYGFLSLEADANTIKGLVFYSHSETPGLGGEIDNPRWQALWPGKKLRNDSGNLVFQVAKGSVDSGASDAAYKVDGLSGATLTANGVGNMVKFWMGDLAYGPYLERRRAASADDQSAASEEEGTEPVSYSDVDATDAL